MELRPASAAIWALIGAICMACAAAVVWAMHQRPQFIEPVPIALSTIRGIVKDNCADDLKAKISVTTYSATVECNLSKGK